MFDSSVKHGSMLSIHQGEMNAFDKVILFLIRLSYELELNFTYSFCVVIS